MITFEDQVPEASGRLQKPSKGLTVACRDPSIIKAEHELELSAARVENRSIICAANWPLRNITVWLGVVPPRTLGGQGWQITRSGVQDQPVQYGETLFLLKNTKIRCG